MSTVDMSIWLKSKGFGVSVQTAFEGLHSSVIVMYTYGIPSAEQEMDGEALMTAFATRSGPDCIKDVIKAYGTRLKVYNAIKAAIGEAYQQNVSFMHMHIIQ